MSDSPFLALGTSMERSALNAVRILRVCEHSLELKLSYLDKDNQTTESAAPVGDPTPCYKLCLQLCECQDISRLLHLEGKMTHAC